MKETMLKALKNPSDYGGADEAFSKIIYWSTELGITLPVSDQKLLNLLRQTCDGSEEAQLELGIICTQVEAI